MTDQHDDTETISNLRREIACLRNERDRARELAHSPSGEAEKSAEMRVTAWRAWLASKSIHGTGPLTDAGLRQAFDALEDESRRCTLDREDELQRELGEQEEEIEALHEQLARKTVYMVQEWGIEHHRVLGVYASEMSAVEAVRRRLLSDDGWPCEGAVQRAHRRRVWRARRQVTAHRLVGARPWLRYQLERVSFRRVRAEAQPWVWSTGRGDSMDYRWGVVAYVVAS